MSVTQRLQLDASEPPLLNRELSWLDLNARVLDLAADPNEPLLERIKFCGISRATSTSSMVRVAGVLDQIASGLPVWSRDGRTPQRTLTEVRERAVELTNEQSRLWREDLCPALAAEGISLAPWRTRPRPSARSSKRCSPTRSSPC